VATEQEQYQLGPSDHVLFLSVKATYEIIGAMGRHMSIICSYTLTGRQHTAHTEVEGWQ
jgi:hypothetical protein